MKKDKITGSGFRRVFEIRKDGMTDGWVTILMKESELFDIKMRVDRYRYLGYEVRLFDLAAGMGDK